MIYAEDLYVVSQDSYFLIVEPRFIFYIRDINIISIERLLPCLRLGKPLGPVCRSDFQLFAATVYRTPHLT